MTEDYSDLSRSRLPLPHHTTEEHWEWWYRSRGRYDSADAARQDGDWIASGGTHWPPEHSDTEEC